MVTVLAISVVIVGIVIVLAVVTTSKAYSYKHTVDQIDEGLDRSTDDNNENKESEDKTS